MPIGVRKYRPSTKVIKSIKNLKCILAPVKFTSGFIGSPTRYKNPGSKRVHIKIIAIYDVMFRGDWSTGWGRWSRDSSSFDQSV